MTLREIKFGYIDWLIENANSWQKLINCEKLIKFAEQDLPKEDIELLKFDLAVAWERVFPESFC